MELMKLYHHKTDGGAEYLFDTFVQCNYCNKCEEKTPDDGLKICKTCGTEKHKEGVINDKTKYTVRIDGDITKDAELFVAENTPKEMTTSQIKKELKQLDELIRGENQCFGRRDLIRESELNKELERRGK